MKFFPVAALAAVAVVVVAKPHNYPHHHAHKVLNREAQHDPAVYEPAPVATVIVYILNGRPISEDEVRRGIANGTLMWDEDGTLSSSAVKPAAIPTLAPKPEAQAPKEQPPPVVEEPMEEQWQEEAPPQPQQPESPPQSDNNGECADCDKVFPNGTIPCSEFPSGYGAVPLDHEGLGGYSGIQFAKYDGPDGYDDIETRPTGSCKDGSCCTPGSFCSYACPNPYLKMSFPKKQGRTKQSVGGLYCNSDGMLEMADGSIANTLCAKGTDKFTVKVENRLSQPVSICRTDYPGTESETIPLTLKPGESGELANPAQSKYFFWDDKPTSAHYYINKKGVPESKACSWGTGEQAVGNWAPTILGTSWDDINMNVGFPSLYQNLPTSHERLDFSITFEGDGVNDPCSYKHTSGEYYKNGVSMGDSGCTAAAKEGSTLRVVFSE